MFDIDWMRTARDTFAVGIDSIETKDEQKSTHVTKASRFTHNLFVEHTPSKRWCAAAASKANKRSRAHAHIHKHKMRLGQIEFDVWFKLLSRAIQWEKSDSPFAASPTIFVCSRPPPPFERPVSIFIVKILSSTHNQCVNTSNRNNATITSKWIICNHEWRRLNGLIC